MTWKNDLEHQLNAQEAELDDLRLTVSMQQDEIIRLGDAVNALRNARMTDVRTMLSFHESLKQMAEYVTGITKILLDQDENRRNK